MVTDNHFGLNIHLSQIACIKNSIIKHRCFKESYFLYQLVVPSGLQRKFENENVPVLESSRVCLLLPRRIHSVVHSPNTYPKTGLWSAYLEAWTPAIYNKILDFNLGEVIIFSRITIYFRYIQTITSIKWRVYSTVFLIMVFKSVLLIIEVWLCLYTYKLL